VSGDDHGSGYGDLHQVNRCATFAGAADLTRLRLGSSDVEVSALCIGTDLIGTRIDRHLIPIVRSLPGKGAEPFIDTREFLRVLASRISGRRERDDNRFLDEGTGHSRSDGDLDKTRFDYPGSTGGLNAAEIEPNARKSLQRLQTDRIDVYYAHRDDAPDAS